MEAERKNISGKELKNSKENDTINHKLLKLLYI